ncbi:alginate export family protein [Alteraurantiacibacter palmitatis]|uniref:Alginate export family protein n=1 Tax=Alteraurantiacibacter palmitatis TaxID=2054628 RepID=A0ABV7E8C2_9SPHN
MRIVAKLLTAAALVAVANPVLAAPGDPIVLGEDVKLDVQAAARLRYESVDQANFTRDAEALTLRMRLGVELDIAGFKALVEGEGTAGLSNRYNDTLEFNGVEPYPTVADPENVELNRVQLAYVKNGTGVTVGRQRINLGNQRFVGSVGWRQNEQTFDAVRGQFKSGVFLANAIYAISQRSIFGVDSPSEHFDGDLVLLNAGIDTASFDVTAFAYVLDYDTRAAFASQTYGLTATYSRALGPGLAIALTGSWASQADTGINPTNYRANHLFGEVSGTLSDFTLAASYEKLGSDGGRAAFQTPLATLHAFQGWADMFLTTPANGVRDYQVSLRKGFSLPALGAVTAQVAYHEFDSDFGGLHYGSEWDASLAFRLGQVNILAKFADYNADRFGTDTQKVWLQAELEF